MSHSGATSNKFSIKKYSLYKTGENVYTRPYILMKKDNIAYCSMSLLMLI